jgi:hypothetical protein
MSTFFFVIVMVHLLAGFGYAMYKIGFDPKSNNDADSAV